MTLVQKSRQANVTAGTMEEMYERADFAKQFGSVIIMIELEVMAQRYRAGALRQMVH